MTELLELDPGALHTVAGWLAAQDNHRWLDFGAGVQVLSPPVLRVMSQREQHCLRLFTPQGSRLPIGIVGLSDIAPRFGTATLWYVLGEKAYSGRGLTARAVDQMLDYGFRHLELEAVQAWAVEENRASIRVLEKNGFRPAGRQRHCHRLDGRPADRLWFDLLASEHRGSLCTTTTTPVH